MFVNTQQLPAEVAKGQHAMAPHMVLTDTIEDKLASLQGSNHRCAVRVPL